METVMSTIVLDHVDFNKLQKVFPQEFLGKSAEQYRVTIHPEDDSIKPWSHEQFKAEVQKGIDSLENGKYTEINSEDDSNIFFERIKNRIISKTIISKTK